MGRNACVTSLLRLRRFNTLATSDVLLLNHSGVHKVGFTLKCETIPKLNPNRLHRIILNVPNILEIFSTPEQSSVFIESESVCSTSTYSVELLVLNLLETLSF
jgi:hypothetical protein